MIADINSILCPLPLLLWSSLWWENVTEQSILDVLWICCWGVPVWRRQQLCQGWHPFILSLQVLSQLRAEDVSHSVLGTCASIWGALAPVLAVQAEKRAQWSARTWRHVVKCCLSSKARTMHCYHLALQRGWQFLPPLALLLFSYILI